MGSVVVANQMQCVVLGGFPIDLAQEGEPFVMTVTRVAASNDRAVERIQCGKERRGAMTLVVVGQRPRTALLQRQPRLGTVQGLNLTLLVAAEHQRMLGWRQIQSDDVFELLDKLRVARDLEGLDQMRLEPIGAPDPQHAAVADPDSCRQRARAPVCGALRCALGGQAYDLGGVDAGLAAATRQISFNPRKPAFRKALAPATHLDSTNIHCSSDPVIIHAFGRQQDYPCPSRQTHADCARPGPSLQLLPLFICKLDNTGCSHVRLLVRSPVQIDRKAYSSINYEALH